MNLHFQGFTISGWQSVKILIFAAVLSLSFVAQAQETTVPTKERAHYQIQLKLDFDKRSYTGSERVKWVNNGDRATAVLYFHLYSNLRPDNATSTNNGSQIADHEEPRLQVTDVRSAIGEAPLTYALEDQGTSLRVNLREPVAPGRATEVLVGFRGSVPEVDSDETGLTSHVVKQVSAALRGDREMRRARDLNFRCRGVLLLGSAYPVLAVRNNEEWLRKLEASVGDTIFNEVADYDVEVEVASGVAVFASAGEEPAKATRENTLFFSASALRDFAIIAGRNLRVEQTQIGDTTLRSIFIPEHDRIGKRVLQLAADALKVFTKKFGPLPLKTISIAEAPLVAGLGSSEFAGLKIIASAYYVDFDSPAMRNLPEIIREQRTSVEESLEWSVAHLVAHAWWGAAVGNNPAREPVLDEAMASWSALLYFREVYGETKVKTVLEDQLRGVYRIYRTFGGEDMDANRPSRDYRNTFQYAAIVTTKGALMLVQLQRLLGEEKLLAAIKNYYRANLNEIADLNDLRGALIAEASIEQRRAVTRTFDRWLASRRGDEDIAGPDPELANSLGLPPKPNQRGNDRNPLSAFARVGKFFWQQVTRIR